MVPINLNNISSSLSPDAAAALATDAVHALYIHVPFCLRKCQYCDFYSLADSSEHMEQYVSAILREASWWRNIHPGIQTIFLGGGTPTMLPLTQMRRLLEGLGHALPIANNAEWTVEANPATIDLPYCRMLKQAGVNRLSIGAQSFIPEELKTLGRVHGADAIIQTIQDAQDAGIGRLSIDLMYAIPGQTPESWQKSLQKALDLNLRHLSCYCLTLEEQTPMWHLTQSGQLPEVDERAQLQYMRMTRTILPEHGLMPYEISNYAAAGEECRHNIHYWRGDNYLGLGPAAASHIAGRRWRNVPDLATYLDEMSKHRLAICDVEHLDIQERATETTMMMLRMAQGIDRSDFARKIGRDPADLFGHALNQLTTLGLVKRQGQHIALTDDGIYVADEVIGELVRELS